MRIPDEWTKTHILIATNRKDEVSIGQLFSFYQDPKDGAYFQEPEYVDYVIRQLGFGQLSMVGYGGSMTEIDFVPVQIDGQEWYIVDPHKI